MIFFCCPKIWRLLWRPMRPYTRLIGFDPQIFNSYGTNLRSTFITPKNFDCFAIKTLIQKYKWCCVNHTTFFSRDRRKRRVPANTATADTETGRPSSGASWKFNSKQLTTARLIDPGPVDGSRNRAVRARYYANRDDRVARRRIVRPNRVRNETLAFNAINGHRATTRSVRFSRWRQTVETASWNVYKPTMEKNIHI